MRFRKTGHVIAVKVSPSAHPGGGDGGTGTGWGAGGILTPPHTPPPSDFSSK